MLVKSRVLLFGIGLLCAVSVIMIWREQELQMKTILKVVRDTQKRLIAPFQKKEEKAIKYDQSTVEGYIQYILNSINPKKRKRESEYFSKYLNDRNSIIQSLPRLSPRSVNTTFHVLVDYTAHRQSPPLSYELIILVSSNTVNFERRKNIRQLWGNINFSFHKTWKVFFITGGTLRITQMAQIYREALHFKDVIILDFMENFSLNMGKKVMSALQWATSKFQYKYTLKCDDDVFVDVDNLLTSLRQIRQDDVYLGNVMIGQEVMRTGRYAVSKLQHSAEKYKDYCSGGGYVLSRHLVQKLIPLFHWEHPFQVDDAYMGALVFEAGVEPIGRNANFLMWNDECQYNEKLLVSHPAKDVVCMRKLFKIVIKKRNMSKKNRNEK